MIALVTGLVSVYSSTSGVVLPAFLPSVPGLVAKLGGGDPLAIASSILIGGHLVDVSPLSTIGALCIASAPITADRRLLFNQVLAWGLSMSVVGALGCYLAFAKMVEWRECRILDLPASELSAMADLSLADRVSRLRPTAVNRVLQKVRQARGRGALARLADARAARHADAAAHRRGGDPRAARRPHRLSRQPG